MVTTTKLTRLSALLPAACAPSPLSPVATPVLAEAWAPISRVHQAQIQAELALAALAPAGGRTNGINGTTGSTSTTGFMGLGVSVDSKRYVDERGVPPRGRPV
jgi:hypothetical protein